MSQPLSNPPPGPPPQKSGGGMSTVMIVFMIGGLVVLLCCGLCGGCMYFGANQATKMRDEVMAKVNTNQAVKDALGEPLPPASPATSRARTCRRAWTSASPVPKGAALFMPLACMAQTASSQAP